MCVKEELMGTIMYYAYHVFIKVFERKCTAWDLTIPGAQL